MHFINIHSLLFAFLLFFNLGCSYHGDRESRLISDAESIVISDPDKTLSLLDSVSNPASLSRDMYNKYIMLRLRAKLNASYSVSDDTLIFSIRKFYKVNKNEHNLMQALYYSGCVLQARGDRDEAIESYLEAQQLAEKLRDAALIGEICLQEGKLYAEEQLFSKALGSYQKSLAYFLENKNIANQILLNNAIATVYCRMNKLDSTLYYYNQSLDLSKQNKDSNFIVSAQKDIGVAYMGIGDTLKARHCFKEGLQYFDTINKPVPLAYLYFSIAQTYYSQNRDSLLLYLAKASSLQKETQDLNLGAQIILFKSQVEELDKNYIQALFLYKQYVGLLDSLSYKRTDMKELNVEYKHANESLLDNNKKLNRQKNLAVFLTILLMLIILIGNVFLLNRCRKVQEAKLYVEQRVKELEAIINGTEDKGEPLREIIREYFNTLKKTSLVEGYLKEDEKKLGQKIIKKYYEAVYNQDDFDWNIFYKVVDVLYDGFPQFLRDAYPDLDEIEVRICCLTFADFNNTEIAIVMKLSVNTIQSKKSFIRKKLGIGGYGNLVEFFRDKMIKS